MPDTKNSILFDTSVLIEFFDKTEKGKIVQEFFSSQRNILFIPTMVLAELTSKLRRKNFEPSQFISAIVFSATVLPLDQETAKRAGELHSQLHTKNKNVSLGDCVVMAHAENEGALIITTDEHFKNCPNAKVI